MHILALIGGGLINFWGDVSLCLVVIVAMGREGTVYGQPYSYPSRGAALFALLPLPLGFIVAGFFVARWGFVGL